MLEQIAVTVTELAIIVILAYFLKGGFNGYLKGKGIKPQETKRVKSILRVKLGRPILTIALPAVLAVVLDVSIALTTGQPVISLDLPIWYLLIQAVAIGPVFEEFAFRGVLFGSSLVIIAKKAPKTKYFWYGVMLVAQAWLFMAWHTAFTYGAVYFNVWRFAGGLLFGALYLIYKKNLVPCIAAHSASNILILFIS